MIGNIYTDAARANWTTVPGRSIDIVNDPNGNPQTITYKDSDGSVVFIQQFTYTNGAVTKIECITA